MEFALFAHFWLFCFIQNILLIMTILNHLKSKNLGNFREFILNHQNQDVNLLYRNRSHGIYRIYAKIILNS